MTIVLLVLAAGGLHAQSAPLITSTEIQAGDSPLVIAAKRAMAARQKAKDRITLTVAPGKGHIFQATGPANVSFKMPPAPPRPAPQKQAGQQNAREELERRIQALVVEQEKLAAQGHEPVAGDGGEEDAVDQRMGVLQRQIDDLRRQLAVLQGTAPPRP